jgi:hypothetical protein
VRGIFETTKNKVSLGPLVRTSQSFARPLLKAPFCLSLPAIPVCNNAVSEVSKMSKTVRTIKPILAALFENFVRKSKQIQLL